MTPVSPGRMEVSARGEEEGLVGEVEEEKETGALDAAEAGAAEVGVFALCEEQACLWPQQEEARCVRGGWPSAGEEEEV